uniref:Putative down syndrome cell adhesion molecule n=1 Tax=Ixodes ricinus TaxID=34613 RepID=A0A6B0V7Y3_IXORI
MSRFYFFVVNSVVILYVLKAAAKGGTGGPCDTDDNCRRDGHFVCRNRTCTCLPGYYEELVNSSLTCSYGRKLGEACRSDSQCEAGSNASYCRGSTCRCRDGYYQESIGGNTTCVPGNPPLLLCYTNYDCFIRDRHLVCDGRFCRCRQGYHTELTAWGWRCADSSGLQRPVHGGVVSVFRISPAAILIACIILGYMKRRQKPEAGPGVHDGRTFGGRPHRYILPFRRGVSLREVAQRGQGERTGDSFDHLLPPAAAVANLPPEPPPYQTDEQEPPPSYEEAVRSIPPSASAASTTATQQTTTNLTTRRA